MNVPTLKKYRAAHGAQEKIPAVAVRFFICLPEPGGCRILLFPVFLGRKAGVMLEVFAEERLIGKVQLVGYLLNALLG